MTILMHKRNRIGWSKMETVIFFCFSFNRDVFWAFSPKIARKSKKKLISGKILKITIFFFTVNLIQDCILLLPQVVYLLLVLKGACGLCKAVTGRCVRHC